MRVTTATNKRSVDVACTKMGYGVAKYLVQRTVVRILLQSLLEDLHRRRHLPPLLQGEGVGLIGPPVPRPFGDARAKEGESQLPIAAIFLQTSPCLIGVTAIRESL